MSGNQVNSVATFPRQSTACTAVVTAHANVIVAAMSALFIVLDTAAGIAPHVALSNEWGDDSFIPCLKRTVTALAQLFKGILGKIFVRQTGFKRVVFKHQRR